MRSTRYIAIFFASVTLVSCDKPKPEVVPLAESTPQATPVSKRLAPEGVYYLTEYISISSEDGVTGFAPGLRVTLIETVGDIVRVSDGKVTIEVRNDQLTNDLDVADSVRTQDSGTQRLAAQARTQAEQYVRILQATYGYGTNFVEVTDHIRGDILAGRTTIRSGNNLVGHDPAFGKVKMLKLTYSIGGGSPISVNLREGESISLPGLPTAQPVKQSPIEKELKDIETKKQIISMQKTALNRERSQYKAQGSANRDRLKLQIDALDDQIFRLKQREQLLRIQQRQ